MVSPPGFEVSATTTDVGFRLLCSIRHSLDHRGLVDQVAVEAEALQRAGAGLLGGLGARAVLLLLILWHRGLGVGQELLVVTGDDLYDLYHHHRRHQQ